MGDAPDNQDSNVLPYVLLALGPVKDSLNVAAVTREQWQVLPRQGRRLHPPCSPDSTRSPILQTHLCLHHFSVSVLPFLFPGKQQLEPGPCLATLNLVYTSESHWSGFMLKISAWSFAHEWQGPLSSFQSHEVKRSSCLQPVLPEVPRRTPAELSSYWCYGNRKQGYGFIS